MAKRTPLSKPVQPDKILAAVIGTSRPLARTTITKKLWAYIKRKKLQVASDRQMIKADKKLMALFNDKPRVHMLDLPGYISDHLV